jgi:SAM-dependent methyltransferase
MRTVIRALPHRGDISMYQLVGLARRYGMNPASARSYDDRDFWAQESQKYRSAHFRLQKAGRIVNGLAGKRECTLLDVGCGPATLRRELQPTIRYFGIDIAISEPGPNLFEIDIVNNPIDLGGQRFDFIVAQGVFEYLGQVQSQKFSEIAELLVDGGTFLVSYINFGHRTAYVYDVYNNVQPLEQFEQDLSRFFTIRRRIPTSHNWSHSEPSRRLVKELNMYFDVTIPYVSSKLAVEYFFVCSRRA